MPFFFNFVRYLPRWVGHHPQEELAKFGYRLERTLEKFRTPTMC
jgi:hypothetical protein